MEENGEITPSRKRKADPSKYARNIQKKARVEGKPYKDSKGRDVPGKTIKEVLCRWVTLTVIFLWKVSYCFTLVVGLNALRSFLMKKSWLFFNGFIL